MGSSAVGGDRLEDGPFEQEFVTFSDGRMRLLLFCRFDRDWKKIEAFVGSKTAIQVAHLLAFVLSVVRMCTVVD